MSGNESALKSSIKLRAIYSILDEKPVSEIMDHLKIPEIIELQKFIWDLAVEFGIKVRGKKFTRKDITRKMPSTTEYQRSVGCGEKIYYCKSTHCINSNPECATQKIKQQVDCMADSIREFMKSAKSNEILA